MKQGSSQSALAGHLAWVQRVHRESTDKLLLVVITTNVSVIRSLKKGLDLGLVSELTIDDLRQDKLERVAEELVQDHH